MNANEARKIAAVKNEQRVNAEFASCLDAVLGAVNCGLYYVDVALVLPETAVRLRNEGYQVTDISTKRTDWRNDSWNEKRTRISW